MPFVKEVMFLELYFEDCIKIMLWADIKMSSLYVAFICRQVQKNIPDSLKKFKTATSFCSSDATFMMVHVAGPLYWNQRGAKRKYHTRH
jgi:hypothetical protein